MLFHHYSVEAAKENTIKKEKVRPKHTTRYFFVPNPHHLLETGAYFWSKFITYWSDKSYTSPVWVSTAAGYIDPKPPTAVAVGLLLSLVQCSSESISVLWTSSVTQQTLYEGHFVGITQ